MALGTVHVLLLDSLILQYCSWSLQVKCRRSYCGRRQHMRLLGLLIPILPGPELC